MKTNRKRNRASMGSVILSVGLFMKAVQTMLAFLGVDAMQSSAVTLAVICVTVGGLSVFALERHGAVSAMAVADAVLVLTGIAWQGKTGGLYTVLYFSVFVLFAIMLWLLDGKRARPFAVAVILLTAVCVLQSVGIISLPLAVVSALLFTLYAVMGVALFF